MNTAEIVELSNQYEMNNYFKRSQALVRGEGVWVWDSEGHRYLDCHSGIGVAALGHAHPTLVNAISQQAGQLITVQGAFHSEIRSQVAARLAAIAPGRLSRSFFVNSGTEAVEAALKTARHSTKRKGIIACTRGFHGRTMGALSATFRKLYREPFMPLVPGFTFVAYNNADALEKAITPDTAAFILEVIQGEGGVHVADQEYLSAVRDICTANDTLLIVDEIQTGFGRTGKMFACDHFGLAPDIMLVAKGMGGGVPVSAMIASDDVTAPTGNHGSTFGGNALAMAAVLATVDTMEKDGLPANAARMGALFCQIMQEANLPVVREIRGLGLMIGLDLTEKAGRFIPKLEARGLLITSAGPKLLRLLPPLIINEAQIRQVAQILIEVLGEK